MGTPSSENLLLGAGSLYFDRIVNGAKTGERHLGNCSAFTLATEVEKVEKYNNMVAARRLYKSVVRQIKATGKITLDEFDIANLALALLGDEGVITQTSGSVTDEKHMAYPGKYFKLDAYGVSDLTVTATSALTVDKDYTVEPKSGMVYIKTEEEGGTLAEATEVTCAYTKADAVLPKVSGATQGNIEGFLRFVGDPAAGPGYMGEFWRVTVSPEGEMGFISDEFGSFGLTIECQDDSQNHASDPLYRLIKYK